MLIRVKSICFDQFLGVFKAESLGLKLLSDHCSFLIEVFLHLLNEPLPLIILAADGFRVYLPSEENIPREPSWVVKAEIGKETFTLFDHVKFGKLNGLHHTLHAVLITLTDHSNDEVHENDVAYDYDQEPEDPYECLVFRPLDQR